ncbi:MAG: FtsX-like permease family protein [Luteitalea sp.]|nr:FtsX-like permease family protein [Luteitalea sp.]
MVRELRVSVYRTLLWCYPASFRREYGSEMVRAFSAHVRDARDHGGWRTEASIWLHTLRDLFLTAPREHAHVMRQDLRYASRTLASNPGFAIVAILSLALGIGANTAIFSLLNSVLISPLPVRDPHELVMLTSPGSAGVGIGSQTGERALLTYSEFEHLREQSTSFSDLMASQSSLQRVQARVNGGESEEIHTRMVSADYFKTLGVPALFGRTFRSEDRVEGAAPYAVISYDYWQRRLGGRTDILGGSMAIRGGVFSIIGVAPASFFGETVGDRPDAWLPLSMQATVLPGRDWLRDQPGSIEKVMWLHVFGRLKPGVTIDKAQAVSNVIFHRGLATYYGESALIPEDRKRFLDQRLTLRSATTGASQIRERFSEPLLILLTAAGVVLLIACANLGNLLLARATARNREISVRLALGASRRRLIRQLLTESMLLAMLGGVAALGAAFLLRAGLLGLVSESIQLPHALDVRVLGFAFGLTMLGGLMLGLLPAWRTTKTSAATGLKEQGRGLAGSAAWQRVGKLVVVGQLALSLPLLVGAGLLVRTLSNLHQVDLGYPKERLLMVRVDAQTAGYEESRRPALFEQVLERLRAVPGVRTATYSKNGLFSGSDSGDQVVVEGYERQGNNDRGSAYDHVGPRYFSTLGIPVTLGREITEDDQPSSRRVCVINEAFAKLFFPGRNPLGMHVTQVYGSQRNTYQIVGVARDSRAHRIRGNIDHRFYVPVTQPVTVPNEVSFAIRTAADPSGLIADVRRAVLQVDPDLPITLRPLTELVGEQTVQDRLLAQLSIAFGVVALLLAAIGLYGVLSCGVARRTNEIGIRKALGAQHSAVIAMILRETGVLLAVGLVAGIALSAAAVRLITSRLYGLEPTDPLTFAVAVAVLSLVALIATWLPAQRASRVDPLVALRHE